MRFMEIDWKYLEASLEHFVKYKHIFVNVKLLLRGFLTLKLNITDIGFYRFLTFKYGFYVDVLGTGGKVGTVKLYRTVYLIPADSYGRGNVCRRMGLGEHILNFTAGFDIPFGHVYLTHILFHSAPIFF